MVKQFIIVKFVEWQLHLPLGKYNLHEKCLVELGKICVPKFLQVDENRNQYTNNTVILLVITKG